MISMMPSSCSCTLGVISHLVHCYGGFTFTRLSVFRLNCDIYDAFLLFLHPRSCFPPSSLLWWVHYYKVVSCFNLCSPFVVGNLSSTISPLHKTICLWKLFWCWLESVGPYAICAHWGIFGFQAMVYGSLRWQLLGNCFEELRNLSKALELKFWLFLFWVFFHQGSRGRLSLTHPHCATLIFWSSPCLLILFGYLHLKCLMKFMLYLFILSNLSSTNVHQCLDYFAIS
jgi:hypothetical protein